MLDDFGFSFVSIRAGLRRSGVAVAVPHERSPINYTANSHGCNRKLATQQSSYPSCRPITLGLYTATYELCRKLCSLVAAPDYYRVVSRENRVYGAVDGYDVHAVDFRQTTTKVACQAVCALAGLDDGSQKFLQAG